MKKRFLLLLTTFTVIISHLFHTARGIISYFIFSGVNLIFLQESGLTILHFYQVNAAVRRHTSMPEMFRILIDILKQCTNCTSMRRNKNCFVCQSRICRFLHPEFSGAFQDIRNVFAVRNVEIIEINDDFIYYAEEKKEEGHNNLFLLEYNRVSKRERVVTHYSLDDPTFVQHLFSFSDSIVLLLENGGDSVWVFRVDKNTGEETARLKIRLIGDFSDCRALDKRHILLWTTANEKYDELFAKYQEKTGNSRIAYLHDLDTAEKYLVKDRILCRLGGEDIVLYSQEGENRALLLNPYGDEAHKEKCYKNARWISQPVCDYIWDGRIAEILEELANGAEALKLKKLVTAGIEGLARYTGMDQKGVYFRARHFPTESECICRCDKATGKVEVLSQLSFDREDCYYHVDVQGCKVYRITEGEETCLVKGIVNSGVQGEYQKQLGEFVSCVEDRFLITRKVMTDSHGNYEFEYHSICDIKKKTEESFECKCVVSKNTLVLY